MYILIPNGKYNLKKTYTIYKWYAFDNSLLISPVERGDVIRFLARRKDVDRRTSRCISRVASESNKPQ